ncbi:MAG: L-threonylcarbamoyladenylate synthase [Fibrobacterales bacterium]
MTSVISVEQIDECVSHLNSGGTLLYPSDTIYGLGCDALNSLAVSKIYDLKNRPANNPFLILIGDPDILSIYFDLSHDQHDLINKIWPGPFTLLLFSNDKRLEHLVGPTGKIGVRFGESHFLSSLFSKWNGFLLSTSANITGEPYVHDALVQSELWSEQVDQMVLLDEYPISNPSTLIDYVDGEWKVLRQGAGKLEAFI